jgi:fructose-1,6-bisphosphatase/inositol monophosphatase family enzyme
VPDLLQPVGELLRRTAAEIVLPRFGSPETATFEKRPGDWVTEADLESEAVLTEQLTLLLPGSTVVGEEAVHADATVLRRLASDNPVWLVDPVDGTANFAAGREPFALIVALVTSGTTTHGWIYLPMEDRMLTSRRGAGVRLDGGGPLAREDRADGIRGIVPLHALPTGDAAEIRDRSKDGAASLVPTMGCAGAEYPAVLDGRVDFVLFTASMPWDHAAGALALSEAGGLAAYLDGRPYTPLDESRRALLIAGTPQVWDRARNDLLGGLA